MDASFGMNFWRRQAKHEGIRTVQMCGWRARRAGYPLCSPVFLPDSYTCLPVLQPTMYHRLYPHWLHWAPPKGLRDRLAANPAVKHLSLPLWNPLAAPQSPSCHSNRQYIYGPLRGTQGPLGVGGVCYVIGRMIWGEGVICMGNGVV